MKKEIIALAVLFGIALMLVPFVAADSYELYCVPHGQMVHLETLCNPAMSPQQGPIQLCMHLLDNGKICPTTINVCNNLGKTCTANANTTIDTLPPTLTIFAPAQNSIFKDKAILLSFNVSESSNVYYVNNINNRGQWKTVCQHCTSYSGKRAFDEGANELIFKAVDEAGNEAFFNRTFFVDTKDPQIKFVSPTSGFTSGLFKVEFTEANPNNLTIKYGNSASGMTSYKVNLAQCTDGVSGKKICEVQADVGLFNNQKIELWAELADIAGNLATSKHYFVDVDFSKPIITTLEYPVDGKYVNFNVVLNEANPGSVSYIDASDANSKWYTLCSNMKTSTCQKKVTFKDGTHQITLRVTDLAGNFVETNISFFTDSKKPVIKQTLPKSGFVASEFEVDFDEQNPQSLILHYGNLVGGMKEKAFNLNNCLFDKVYKCTENVDLASYNGQQINYYFVLTDKVSQIAESKHLTITVDTAYPKINGMNYTLSGKKADVTLTVDEVNLAEVVYTNNADATPKERVFCTKLTSGKCRAKITLNSGANQITFQAVDKAGNSVSQSYSITSA